MSYFKLPKNWTENDCNKAIDNLLNSGMKQLGYEDYEKSSKSFLKIAQIIRSLPELRRRKLLEEKRIHDEQRLMKQRGITREEYLKEMLEKKTA